MRMDREALGWAEGPGGGLLARLVGEAFARAVGDEPDDSTEGCAEV